MTKEVIDIHFFVEAKIVFWFGGQPAR